MTFDIRLLMIFKNLTKNSAISINIPDTYIYFFYNLSGEIIIDIKCANAKVFLFGLYIGKNNQKYKINKIQHHIIINNKYNLLIKGVFFDQSKFDYHGLIKIDKNAQKSNAYQKNKNLLLSDEAVINSKPDLEILADDVRCTHGSTTGPINEEWIYYLKTRGLNRTNAEKLIIDGFIGEIFDKIKLHQLSSPI